MSATRRTTEVKEQAEHFGILTFLQYNTLLFQDERLIASHIMLLYEEVVVITTIGEFHRHAWTVLVRLHHKIEVVLLGSARCQFGINVELALPL